MNYAQQNKSDVVSDNDDVGDVLSEAQHKRRIARQYRRPYSKRQSKLEQHRSVIFAMRSRGASLEDIVVALRSILKPRVACVSSTVKRYLDAG